jgi:hypothetical protein
MESPGITTCKPQNSTPDAGRHFTHTPSPTTPSASAYPLSMPTRRGQAHRQPRLHPQLALEAGIGPRVHVRSPHAHHDAAYFTVRIIHGVQQHPLGLCKTPVQRAAGVVPPQLFYLYSHYISARFLSDSVYSCATATQRLSDPNQFIQHSTFNCSSAAEIFLLLQFGRCSLSLPSSIPYLTDGNYFYCTNTYWQRDGLNRIRASWTTPAIDLK